MTIIAPAQPTATAATACQPYCLIHDNEFCLAPDIHLDFGDRGPNGDTCHDVRTSLTHNTDTGTATVGLAINANGFVELDDDQATAIIHGLLAQLALKRGDTDTAAMHREYALEHAHTIDATAPGRPVAAGDRVTWTSKCSGQTHAGTVETIQTWRGVPEALVDTDTDGPHKVTTTIGVDQLTRIGGAS